MDLFIFGIGILTGLIFGAGLTVFLAKKDENSLKNELQQTQISNETLKIELAKNQKELELVDKKEEIKNQLILEFENLAAKIFKESTQDFSKNSKENLESVIKPFKERIVEFSQQIEKIRGDEVKDIISLKEQIKNLNENSVKLSSDAKNLTKALKGENKKQGDLGEVLLTKTLEMSGLREGIEFVTQETTNSRRPDVVVYLPENKHIIIDAKVTLNSYDNYFNTDDSNAKDSYLKDFINSIKTHVKGLAEKAYQNLEDLNSPDFVLMFMPFDAPFQLLLQQDQKILSDAWKNKIIIVGPSTLFAALKTINVFWNQERQTRNVQKIITESGSLYDKFVGFIESLEKAQKSAELTKGTIDDAFNKLKDGKGNIIRRVENLRTLGAKTTKQIPEKYLDEDETLVAEEIETPQEELFAN